MSKLTFITENQSRLTQLVNTLGGNLNDDTIRSVAKNFNDNNQWLASNKFANSAKFVDDFIKQTVDDENQLILPKTSAPQRYKIQLDARNIHTGSRAFTGEVDIDLTIKEATDKILIHSKSQVIDELKVFNKNDMTEVPLIEFNLYAPADTLAIYFMSTLQVGAQLVVNIKYSTNLLTSGTGFYQTSYDINLERRYLGATQFESTGGRYAFPHYDEPGYKAVFELSITHDASLHAIANTFGTLTSK